MRYFCPIHFRSEFSLLLHTNAYIFVIRRLCQFLSTFKNIFKVLPTNYKLPCSKEINFWYPLTMKPNHCAHSSVNTYLFFWFAPFLSWLEYYVSSNFKFLYIIHIFGTPTRVNHYHCAMCIRMSTMKPKYFWIQIWWYQTFLII